MTCSRSTRNSSRKRCSRNERPIFRLLTMPSDSDYMRLALRLARRGYGSTSPNPMVGAVLVKGGRIIGRGWHRRAGGPHAEIEALRNAQMRGHKVKGATLYVTLEPCSTHGRTPPCTAAILAAGIRTSGGWRGGSESAASRQGFRHSAAGGHHRHARCDGRRMRAAQ